MTQQLNKRDSLPVLHVRFDGRSQELDLSALHLNPNSSDDQIKQALAAYLERPAGYFRSYVVVRTEKAIIVRPEAIYG
ncbi:MAG TPA: hypothetical protein VH186_30780 [Chloroflexia bacterium]|nr:hypothetical protein [Chloroflexia bacterium]